MPFPCISGEGCRPLQAAQAASAGQASNADDRATVPAAAPGARPIAARFRLGPAPCDSRSTAGGGIVGVSHVAMVSAVSGRRAS